MWRELTGTSFLGLATLLAGCETPIIGTEEAGGMPISLLTADAIEGSEPDSCDGSNGEAPEQNPNCGGGPEDPPPEPVCAWRTTDDFAPQSSWGNGDAAANVILRDGRGTLYAAGAAGVPIGVPGAWAGSGWSMRFSRDGGRSWNHLESYQHGGETLTWIHAVGIGPSGWVTEFGATETGSGLTSFWIGRIRVPYDGFGNFIPAPHQSTWLIDEYQYQPGLYAVANSVVTDSAGNIFVTGWASAGPSGNRHWITKKSSNSGTTWTVVDDFVHVPGFSTRATSMVIGDSGEILVAGYGYRTQLGSEMDWLVRRSRDSGASWETVEIFNSSAVSAPTAIAAGPSGRVYVAGNVGSSGPSRWVVRRSEDRGDSWETVDGYTYTDQGAGAAGIAVDQAGAVYAVGQGYAEGIAHKWIVRKSGDNGDSWTTVDDFLLDPHGASRAKAITFDSEGNPVVAGSGEVIEGTGPNLPDLHWLIRRYSCE